jgi:large subunit ribosomal protein L35
MPKMKTKRSAKKRFRVTGSGKVVHNRAGNRHFGVRKSPKRKRRLRKDTCMSKAMTSRTKKMIQS